MKRRYFEWDYVADTVIEWERHGSCKQCGACCRSGIEFIVHRPYKRDCRSGGREARESGIWQEVHMGRWRYFFSVTRIDPAHDGQCCELTEDNLCAMHTDKCFLCREWPFSPRCVAPFPECGYSFTEVQRGRISELRGGDDEDIPHPGA